MTDCDALKLIDEFIKRSTVPVHHHHDLYQYYSQETPRLGSRERRDILGQTQAGVVVGVGSNGGNNAKLANTLLALQRHQHPLFTNANARLLNNHHHSDASETSFDSSYHSTSYPSSSSRPVSIEKNDENVRSMNSPRVVVANSAALSSTRVDEFIMIESMQHHQNKQQPFHQRRPNGYVVTRHTSETPPQSPPQSASSPGTSADENVYANGDIDFSTNGMTF